MKRNKSVPQPGISIKSQSHNTPEGQSVAKMERRAGLLKVEQLLREKGYDVKGFQSALESGKAKQRVLADMALARKQIANYRNTDQDCHWRSHRRRNSG